jgi:hypothetical protein
MGDNKTQASENPERSDADEKQTIGEARTKATQSAVSMCHT